MQNQLVSKLKPMRGIILSMVDNLLSFLEWLQLAMNDKSVTPADIARTGFVTNSAVSLLFSMKTKSLSYEMCRAISAATNIPLEVVYQKAGLLPVPSGLSDEQQAVIHAVSQVKDDKTLRMISAMLTQAQDEINRDKQGRK